MHSVHFNTRSLIICIIIGELYIYRSSGEDFDNDQMVILATSTVSNCSLIKKLESKYKLAPITFNMSKYSFDIEEILTWKWLNE